MMTSRQVFILRIASSRLAAAGKKEERGYNRSCTRENSLKSAWGSFQLDAIVINSFSTGEYKDDETLFFRLSKSPSTIQQTLEMDAVICRLGNASFNRLISRANNASPSTFRTWGRISSKREGGRDASALHASSCTPEWEWYVALQIQSTLFLRYYSWSIESYLLYGLNCIQWRIQDKAKSIVVCPDDSESSQRVKKG